MKIRLLFSLIATSLILLGGYFFYNSSESTQSFPAPTNGKTEIRIADEEGNQYAREQWIEQMHRAAPGVNWRDIERQNQAKRHEDRLSNRYSAQLRNGYEVVADGNLKGYWAERGSRNQAGSVVKTTFDSENDLIYLVSDGGTIFRGAVDGSDWRVVNQDFKFDGRILKMIDTGNGTRMIATVAGVPYFSDDMGISWTESDGVRNIDKFGSAYELFSLNDSLNTLYLASKPSQFNTYRLYKSIDIGENWDRLDRLGDNNASDFKMIQPSGTDDIYLVEKFSDRSSLYQLNPETDEFDELVKNSQDFGFRDYRANLAGVMVDTTLRLYIYGANDEIKKSEDKGETWEVVGVLPQSPGNPDEAIAPWEVGLFVSPSDPDVMLMGAVNCYRSYEEGSNLLLQNAWWEYYDDVEHKLHADIMYFDEFVDSQGRPFILISNHGGLSISYDYLRNVENIGLEGLNVSQYYDVLTDPLDPDVIYAGTQDQGFQRGIQDDPNETVYFEQVISGDYGHMNFTNSGEHLWIVYPFGWISVYNDPTNGELSTSYTIDSENEFVWICPTMSSPFPEEDVLYVAGGDTTGGAGSHIIRLEFDGISNISASNLPFDFMTEAGANISALRTSPLDPSRWYVATTNGRFFTSSDTGRTWEQTIEFLPDGNYLYGQAILPSKIDSSTVYFGGSGYSNPAVFKSVNDGEIFVEMNNGLPRTTVFEMVANEDESMIFAATEDGPYVWIDSLGEWFDMGGTSAPAQTYWSVEFLEEDQTVRFGTYGRGIWDFQLNKEEIVSTRDLPVETLSIFPNPTSGMINIDVAQEDIANSVILAYDLSGKVVGSWQSNTLPLNGQSLQLDLAYLPSGNYLVSVSNATSIKSGQVILNR